MDRREAGAWARRSRRDPAEARWLWAAGAGPENVRFLAHQAAEKAIKSGFLDADLPVPRSHDLEMLAGQLKIAGLAALTGEFASLNRWVGLARYPSVVDEYFGEAPDQAIRYTSAILTLVLGPGAESLTQEVA